MENRRAMQRFILKLVSIVSVDGENPEIKMNHQYAIAENICAGGVYLKTCKPLELKTRVKIKVFLPVPKNTVPFYKNISLIKVAGEVVRNDVFGMAVKFDKKYSITPLN